MSGRPRGIRNDAGMTAIEVVVALVILSTVLLGIAATTSTAAKSLTAGQRQVENSAAIQYQAETLLSVPFDSLASGTSRVQGVPCKWTVSESKDDLAPATTIRARSTNAP